MRAPLLGILASSYPQAPATSFESIATVTVGSGGSSSISFSSIPNTYKHLQIRGIARNTGGTTTFELTTIQFNSDTSTANYAIHQLRGDGSTAAAIGYGTGTVGYGIAGYNASGGNTAGIFGTTIIDILDYTNTSKYKTIRSLNGWDKNGAGNVSLASSLWLNTNAITSITLGDQSYNLAQYSSFALYGVKG